MENLCEFDRVQVVKNATKKLNLKNWHEHKVFKEFIYPVFAREFLFGDSYEKFAELVQSRFILTEKQWECILIEWEFKQTMLS